MEKDLNLALQDFITTHEGWSFILRDGKNTVKQQGEYMCHLMSPEWTDGYGTKGGAHNLGWGATPLEAFNNAYWSLR